MPALAVGLWLALTDYIGGSLFTIRGEPILFARYSTMAECISSMRPPRHFLDLPGPDDPSVWSVRIMVHPAYTEQRPNYRFWCASL